MVGGLGAERYNRGHLLTQSVKCFPSHLRLEDVSDV